MTVGKNKKLGKKKGTKKKIVDPFARKDWYDIRAPLGFKERDVGKTPVNKTIGTKISTDFLKNRVFEVSLADLQKNQDDSFRKIKLRVEDIQGNKCLTNFYGMDLTTDKLRSLIRKRQTLIEAHVDVKTADGYHLRLFSIAFTKKRPNQEKRTAYAQSSQIRAIRRKMVEIMTKEASTSELKELVQKFILEAIGNQIEKACKGIYPLQNVFVRKVKVLKTPKFDPSKILELHGEIISKESQEDTGVKA